MALSDFPGYTIKDDVLYNPLGVAVRLITTATGRKSFKAKNHKGKWVHLSLARFKVMCGKKLKLPVDAKLITGCEHSYLDKKGTVYTFSKTYPQGKILTVCAKPGRYPHVQVEGKTREIHNMMVSTFILPGYAKKGLVCLHTDNNKLNYALSNLSVGTYSRNNKDAYNDGLQSSKLGSHEHGVLSSKRFEWATIDLPQLIEACNGVNTTIAKQIGCSSRTVAKKRKELGI